MACKWLPEAVLGRGPYCRDPPLLSLGIMGLLGKCAANCALKKKGWLSDRKEAFSELAP